MTDTHIKINPVIPKVQYTGNGSTTIFPYEFAIFDESEMIVYFGDEVQETGYTVSGAGQTAGGSVTFDTAPAEGVIVTLMRNITIERVTDFQEGGTFRPKNINDELDRITAVEQQLEEGLQRALKVHPTSPIADLTLSEPVPKRALKWNEDGTGIESSVYDPDEVATDAAESATAAAASAASAQSNATALKYSYLNYPYFFPGESITYVDATTFKIADDSLITDYSKYYKANRRIKVVTPTQEYYGTIGSSSYSSGETTVHVAMDGGVNFPSTATMVYIGFSTEDMTSFQGPNLLGMVLPWTADPANVPAGFGLADGSYFDKDIYPALEALYDTGTTDPDTGNKIYLHGGVEVDGVWQPKKPDVRGYFPRFLDPRSQDAVDPSAPRTVGSTQGHALQGHKHALDYSTQISGTSGAQYTGLASGGSNSSGEATDSTYGTVTVSTETRPVNIALPGLLVMYGGYSSATGLRVEDLLTLTEAAAQDYIDEIAEPIQEAVSDAQGYANDASGYADDAQGYANDASGYADTASGYVSDAQGYANDASGYADAAAASATQAEATMPTAGTYTLISSSWTGENTYALTVSGLKTTSTVFVSPAPSLDGSNEALYASSGIRAVTQATNTLTFVCTEVPSSDVSVVLAVYS